MLHIKAMKNLKGLYLNHTLVSVNGLPHLENLKNLETLWIVNRRINHNHLTYLKSILPEGCAINVRQPSNNP